MHRFYIKDNIPDKGVFILDNRETSHQILNVLKLKKGERIRFFNGTGFDFDMVLERISGRFVAGNIVSKIGNFSDPKIIVNLFQSIPKKDKFEWVLEKGTELGVKYFHPILTKRSQKKDINFIRAQKILKEAMEQSGQDKIPEIGEVIKFERATDLVSGKDSTNIIFDPSGEPFTAKDTVKYDVNVFVGPEGGFSDEELKSAKEKGLAVKSLGPRTLKAETAAIAISAIYLTLNRD